MESCKVFYANNTAKSNKERMEENTGNEKEKVKDFKG